ncbi:MAG: PDZ domain-containing protein [Candidatus Cloacimonetes bacterium]|nr:PDZ domain-containing protein [Candidatus Cloacimonadota bacterium]
MKKLVVLIAVSALLFGSLVADDLQDAQKAFQFELQAMKDEIRLEFADNEDVQKKLEEVEKKLEAKGVMDYTVDVNYDDDTSTITINTGNTSVEKPFIGVTYSDLLLSDAAQIDYKYFYGIRLDTIVPGSPAHYFRLRTGDILMQINENKINQQKELGKVLSYYRVGDKVTLTIFRDGKVMEIPFVLGTREKVFDLDGNLTEESKKEVSTEILIKKQKKDYGDGTIAWIPSWYMPDVEDINAKMQDLGFEEETLSEDGYLLNGIGFKGNIGKGWFIGGQFSQHFERNSIQHLWEHYDKYGVLVTTQVDRKVKYWSQFGGPTLDKRFVFGKYIYSELGMMIAWGQNKLTVDQKIEDPTNIDFEDDISNNIDDYYNYTSNLEMKNNFIMVEPRASIGWRITDWLSLKAEAAYLYSYSTTGWKATRNGSDVNVDNEPDTSMDGLRISFGPWFGF